MPGHDTGRSEVGVSELRTMGKDAELTGPQGAVAILRGTAFYLTQQRGLPFGAAGQTVWVMRTEHDVFVIEDGDIDYLRSISETLPASKPPGPPDPPEGYRDFRMNDNTWGKTAK